MEKYDDAIKEYNKIIELCVDNLEKSEALIEIGLIYYKKLDYIQAFLKFDEAKQLNNNLDVTTIDFDNELIDRNLAEELGQFNKIFELNIDSELIALAHIEIGRILKSEGDFTKAENHYGEAIRINPNSSLEALALIELGNIFLEQKNDGLAIEKYISAKKINHNSDSIHYNLAYCFKDKKMYDEALSEIGEAIKINPKDSDYYNLRGNIFWSKKQRSKAIEQYKEAIKVEPSYYWPHLNLARLYMKNNQNEKAVEEFGYCLKYAEEYGERETRARNSLKKLGFSESDIEKLKNNYQEHEIDIENENLVNYNKTIQSLVNKYKEYENENKEEVNSRREYHQKYNKFLLIECLESISIKKFDTFLHNFLYSNGRMTLTGNWRGVLEKNSRDVKNGLFELFSSLENGISLDNAVDTFLSKMPVNCEAFITAILFDYDIKHFIPFSTRIIKRMKRLNLYPLEILDKNSSFGKRYIKCNEILLDFSEKYDLTLDSLDHFLWWIDDSDFNLSNENKIENVPSIIVDSTNSSYTIEDALDKLFLSKLRFKQMLRALDEKKNVILQGPPGVGKTFIAKRLAYTLMGMKDHARIEMIQFHQSYSYEDFIQGFRPTNEGHFELKNGVFYQFCRKAQNDPENKPHIFIIDEINRGNLSKIFGELMMLIEPDKRGEKYSIPLTYSQSADETFFIPENVYMIGTMNTADRSLAMVDYALRRRFKFITLKPEFQSNVFRKYLNNCGAEESLINKIINRMTSLNNEISADSKNLGVGYQIGHSYFCPNQNVRVDKYWYQNVIESEIIPLLREYWFDDEERVNHLEISLQD